MRLCRHTDRVLLCRGDVDLNRDFPDPLLLGSTGLYPTGDEQPETLALMKWTSGTHFVASASMHEVGPPAHPFFCCAMVFLGRLLFRSAAHVKPDLGKFVHA